MIWLKLVWKLFKLGLKSKRSGKAVQWVTIYQLALDGLSETLQKAAPPGTTVLTAIGGLQEYIPAAQKLIDHPPDGKFDAENPNRAVYLMAESLETGITRNFLVPARTLRQFDELSKDPAFTEEQKEKLAQMCVDSYLVGLLAPVMQLDIFERELDDLLLETRCKTREEISQKLQDSNLDQKLLAQAVEILKQLQARDIEKSCGDVAALDRHIHRLHRAYNDIDNWATVPDCVDVVADMLREDELQGNGNSKKFLPESVRVNIQRRLREAQAESRRAANADFYRTIDIATEAAAEYDRYTAGQYLKEFNCIASPHDNLRRARKKREV